MKLPSWLRRKAPETKLVCTVEIVTGKSAARPDLPEFCVEEPEGIVNLWPFAAEVLSQYPEKVTADVDTLARLAVKRYSGRHIKVAEYSAETDREIVQMLIYRVIRWSRWPREHSKMQRGGGGYFPARHLVCNPSTACAGALALRGRHIPVEDVRRLPLEGCWSRHCQCHYRVVDRNGRAV